MRIWKDWRWRRRELVCCNRWYPSFLRCRSFGCRRSAERLIADSTPRRTQEYYFDLIFLLDFSLLFPFQVVSCPADPVWVNEGNSIGHSVNFGISSSARQTNFRGVESNHCEDNDNGSDISMWEISESPAESSPRSQVKANWIAFPPTPQKASTITLLRPVWGNSQSVRRITACWFKTLYSQRSAIWTAMFSGVTEYHPSRSISQPSSNFANNLYLCAQSTFTLTASAQFNSPRRSRNVHFSNSFGRFFPSSYWVISPNLVPASSLHSSSCSSSSSRARFFPLRSDEGWVGIKWCSSGSGKASPRSCAMIDKYGFTPDVFELDAMGWEVGRGFVDGGLESGMMVLTGLIKALTNGELRIELCFRFGRIILTRCGWSQKWGRAESLAKEVSRL